LKTKNDEMASEERSEYERTKNNFYELSVSSSCFITTGIIVTAMRLIVYLTALVREQGGYRQWTL